MYDHAHYSARINTGLRKQESVRRYVQIDDFYSFAQCMEHVFNFLFFSVQDF